ncbi:MAG: hypothetical protein PHP44_15745 [Kiritimatiellae bacterium]|nr:hypothetical protein [Kiritimatiellia bacterium]
MKRMLIGLIFLGIFNSVSFGQLGQPRAVIDHDFGPAVDRVSSGDKLLDLHMTDDGWIHLAAYDDHGCCQLASQPVDNREITAQEIEAMLDYGSDSKRWSLIKEGCWLRSDGASAMIQSNGCFAMLSAKESNIPAETLRLFFPEPKTPPAIETIQEKNLPRIDLLDIKVSIGRPIIRAYVHADRNVPEKTLRDCANIVWAHKASAADESTVFLIHGPILNFDNGATVIAEFTSEGPATFKLNNTPLKMLDLR